MQIIGGIFPWILMYVVVGVATAFGIDNIKWWMYIPIVIFWPILFAIFILFLIYAIVAGCCIEIGQMLKRWKIFGSR